VSDRDAGGSEMATVSSDQSTIAEPASVPILKMAHHNAIHETAKPDAQFTEKRQQPGINRGAGIAA